VSGNTLNPQSKLTSNTHICRQLACVGGIFKLGRSQNLPSHIYMEMCMWMTKRWKLEWKSKSC